MLTQASQPSGSAIRKASASALATHTGSERSSIIASRAGTRASRAEELHEALLDLLVTLEQFGGIHREQLQLGELRLVGRVLHLGVAGVEALAVGQELLQLTAEREVGEQARRVRMRRERGDGRGRDDERH